MRRHGPEFDEGSEADPIPSIVTISLKDGRSFEARQAIPKGDAANPLNDAERLAKFEDCCRGFLAAGDIARLKDAIEGMAGLSRIGECTRLLRFEAGSDAGERFERRA
jgi:2-methylcitrate dehydratase PrpD